MKSNNNLNRGAFSSSFVVPMSAANTGGF